MKTTGEMIRVYRKKRGMKQAELAKALKSAPQFVSLIESGRSFLPARSIDRVAKALKIDRKVLVKQMVADYKRELMA